MIQACTDTRQHNGKCKRKNDGMVLTIQKQKHQMLENDSANNRQILQVPDKF